MITKILNRINSLFYRFKYWFKFNKRNFFCEGKVIVKGKNKINIDSGVVFYNNVKITNNGNLHIGKNVKIGDNTIIYCSNNISIGDNTIIAANTYIIDCDHSFKRNELISLQELDKGSVYIGQDCWIAENCTILKNSYIGNGSVIGAKALVKHNIPPYMVAVGIPARIIKERT